MERGDTFACPVCGETVPARALACPGCGSDERTGWSDEAALDVADLPASSLDEEEYEDFVEDDLGRSGARVPLWVLLTTAVLLLAIFYAWVLL